MFTSILRVKLNIFGQRLWIFMYLIPNVNLRNSKYFFTKLEVFLSQLIRNQLPQDIGGKYC